MAQKKVLLSQFSNQEKEKEAQRIQVICVSKIRESKGHGELDRRQPESHLGLSWQQNDRRETYPPRGEGLWMLTVGLDFIWLWYPETLSAEVFTFPFTRVTFP